MVITAKQGPTFVDLVLEPATFEAANPYAGDGDVTLLVAGGDKVPEIEIQEFSAVRFLNGKAVEHATTVPLSNDGRSRTLDFARVLLAGQGQIRHWRVYPIQVQARLIDSPDNDQWVVERCALRIDLGAPADPPKVNLTSDEHLKLVASAPAEIINPSVPVGYLSPYSKPEPDSRAGGWISLLDQAAKSGSRVFVARPTSATLLALPSPDIAGHVWRAYRDGAEVPLLEKDGRLALVPEFHPEWSAGADEVVLIKGPQSIRPSAPKRLKASALVSPRTNGTTDSLRMGGVFRVTSRPLTGYEPKLSGDRSIDRWHAGTIGPQGKFAALRLSLPAWFSEAELPQSDVSLRFMAGPDGRVKIEGETLINGRGRFETLAIQSATGFESRHDSTGMLQAGNNSVVVRPIAPNSPPGFLRSACVNWRQVLSPSDYAQWLNQEAASVTFVASLDGVARSFGSVAAQDNGGVPDGIIWRGFHRDRGVWHVVSESTYSGLEKFHGLADEVWEWWPERFPSETGLAAFKEIPEAEYSNLLEPDRSADGLIVAPSQFVAACSEWVAKSGARSGLAWQVASMDGIGLVHGFGRHSAEAVARFIRDNGGPLTRYVMLAGECSDWPFADSMRTASVAANLVPTAVATRATPHGDATFARAFNGGNYADVSVGRIPAKTLEELVAILARSDDEETLDADGQRPGRFLQVLDDDDEFESAAQEARRAIAPAEVAVLQQGDFGYVNNVKVEGRRRSRTATETLVTTWTLPWRAVTFYGHGGPNLFSHERLLHLQDMVFLNAPAPAPIVACASCDNAWLNFPTAPVAVSFAENLMLQKNAARAVFGPTSGATSYEHKTLMARFHEALVRPADANMRVGDAARYAVNLHYARTLSSHVPNQYVLLGDPAQRIAQNPPESKWPQPAAVPKPDSSPRSALFSETSGWRFQWGAGVDPDQFFTDGVAQTLSIRITAPDAVEEANLLAELHDAAGMTTAAMSARSIEPGQPRLLFLSFPRPPRGQTARVVFSMHATTAGSTDSKRAATWEFSLPVRKGANLSWVADSATVSMEGPAFAQSTVFLKGLLVNTGDLPSAKFDIQARANHPADGPLLKTINELAGQQVAPLQPGERRWLTFRWEDAAEPGDHRLFLIANSPRQAAESTTDDNVLTMPLVSLSPLPNMAAKINRVVPPIVRPGQRATIDFEISDTWPGGRGPVEVQFGFRNPATGVESLRKIVVPDLEKPQRIQGPHDTGPQPMEAVAIVNSDKDWEELDPLSSVATRVADPLLTVDEWAGETSPGQPISIRPRIGFVTGAAVSHLPDQGLAVAGTASGTRYEVLAVPQHALSMAARPGEPDTDVFGPMTWRFQNNSFQAAAVDTPSDLTLNIPVPDTGFLTTTAALSVEVAIGQIRGQSHKFSVQAGGVGEFVPVHVANDPLREAIWRDIGYVPVENGVVRLRIRPMPGAVGAIARFAVVVPKVSAQSAWFELSDDMAGTSVSIAPKWLGASTPGASWTDRKNFTTTTLFMVRTATLGSDPNEPLVRGDWKPVDFPGQGGEVAFEPGAVAWQWRADWILTFVDSDGHRGRRIDTLRLPILTDVTFSRAPSGK